MTTDRAKYTFPRRTLEVALKVPRSLKENNGGNPWPPGEVAQVLDVGARGSTFFYIASASQQYGLTIGGRDAATVELTDLGRRAVYPETPQEERGALQDAFLSVSTFRAVLEHFKGNNLPEARFRENTLERTFGLEPDVQ